METKGVTTKTQAWSSFHKSFGRRGSNYNIRLFPKQVGSIPETVRFCATVSRHSFCSHFKPDIRYMTKMLQRIAQSCFKFIVSELCIARGKLTVSARTMLIYKQFSRSVNHLSQSCQQSSIQPIRSWYQELVSWNGGINGMSTGSPAHSLLTRPLSARPARPRLWHSAILP